jgi:hypothetical protein
MELSPSFFKIIAFIFLIAVIQISLKTISFFAKRLLKNQQFRSFWKRYFGGFELVIWLVFGLLSIEYFWINNRIIAIIIAVIVTVILFILIHYYFKEILAGIFLKLSADIKPGDEVKNNEFAGKIIQIQNNQLIIESVDGIQTGIPYSKLIFNPLIKQSPSTYLHRFESIFVVPNSTDRKQIQQQINTILMADLRVSASIEPKVSFTDLNEENYQIKVIAFLFNPADKESIRELILTPIKKPGRNFRA